MDDGHFFGLCHTPRAKLLACCADSVHGATAGAGEGRGSGRELGGSSCRVGPSFGANRSGIERRYRRSDLWLATVQKSGKSVGFDVEADAETESPSVLTEGMYVTGSGVGALPHCAHRALDKFIHNMVHL